MGSNVTKVRKIYIDINSRPKAKNGKFAKSICPQKGVVERGRRLLLVLGSYVLNLGPFTSTINEKIKTPFRDRKGKTV